jgi:hypothetical protein
MSTAIITEGSVSSPNSGSRRIRAVYGALSGVV